jgi:hypothetical protein
MAESLAGFLFPIGLVSMMTIMWWAAQWIRYRRYFTLSHTGELVQAVVFEKLAYRIIGGVTLHYDQPVMRYRFLTPRGKEVISRKMEIPFLMQSIEEQDSIAVRYLLENPEINYPERYLKTYLAGLYYWIFVPFICWIVLMVPFIYMLIVRH